MNAETLVSTVVVSVIGLAIVAVLVSNRAKTSDVIGASGSSLAKVIGAAVSPVTGGGSYTMSFASGGLAPPTFPPLFGSPNN